MNGVTLQIIDTYDECRGENYELITIPRKYVRITDDCTNISVTMSVEEFKELQQITNSNGSTFPRPETSNENGSNEN
jgi:lipoate synthase